MQERTIQNIFHCVSKLKFQIGCQYILVTGRSVAISGNENLFKHKRWQHAGRCVVAAARGRTC